MTQDYDPGWRHLLPFVDGIATDICGCTYKRFGHNEIDVLGTRSTPVITHVEVERCPQHSGDHAAELAALRGLRKAAQKAHDALDEANAAEGNVDRLCLVCGACEYDAKHGIDHHEDCAILILRDALSRFEVTE